MKIFILMLLSITAVSCDPYGFGFKVNPAYVIDTAFKAVTNLDKESFLEVSGKEALCLYANESGLSYLKENVLLDATTVKFDPKLVSSQYFKNPAYVGYWSYYTERYLVGVSQRSTGKKVLDVVVDCYYGSAGEKNESYLNLAPKKYRSKECRLTKVVARSFDSLDASKCGVLKVELL